MIDMNFKIGIYFLLSLLYLLQVGCSHKLKPIAQRSQEQLNSNLTYEQDSVEQFVVYRGFVVQFNREKRMVKSDASEGFHSWRQNNVSESMVFVSQIHCTIIPTSVHH